MSRLGSWLLAIPFTAGSLTMGHWLTYRIAVSDPHERHETLAHSGHAYLEHAPFAIALCGALALVVLARRVVGAVRGREGPPPLAWSFALLPPLAFAIQEHLERVVHTGELPWTSALALPLALGLLVQAPFALLAVVVARALESLATRLGLALAAPPPRVRLSLAVRGPAREARPSRRRGLALGYAERGPPIFAGP